MQKNIKKGFTLIELLVVIAIIGILSSIVLASMNTARGKSANAKIKAQLANARSAAEAYYDSDPEKDYNGTAGDVSGDCTTVGSMFTDTASNMSAFTTVANYPGTPTLSCYSTATAYAISATLFVPDTSFDTWCVDSTGTSKGIVGAVATTNC
ncbi:MAG: prepilin-type N-terminal cleavage/methylation domain-containing protein [Patescibacteria group bacterium]